MIYVMRTAIYTRISEDQTGERLGVERQLQDCQAKADQLGWTVTAHFDDNDLSAFNGKHRPGFEALLDAMRHAQIDALICWHTDRLYRSMKDLERLIDIADAGRIQLRTVQGGDLDLSTSAGRMLARILGSVARQESEHKGERQRSANIQKALAGKWSSANRPFGYAQDGKRLEPEAMMIRTAVADVLAGKSIKQVAREWNATGITGTRGSAFTSPNVRRILINPRYAGLRAHNGKVVATGKWEALIDEDTHLGLVAFLRDPSRIVCTAFEKKHLGSGVYLCGVCGSALRHTVSGGKQAGQRKYECSESNSHVVVTGPPVDELVEAVVLKMLSGSDIHRRITGSENIDVDAFRARRTALQARLDELATMFAQGAIDGSQLRTGTEDLKEQLAKVSGVLADAARTSPTAKLLEAAATVEEAWSAAAADIKGKIVDELMVVTVNKATRRGGPGFDHDRVDIKPKV
jgi:site-specific DNA recombinase